MILRHTWQNLRLIPPDLHLVGSFLAQFTHMAGWSICIR